MESDAPSLATVLGTFAVDAGLAWMIGCVAVTSWARTRTGAWSNAMRRRHLRGLVFACGTTVLALAFDLWRRSAEAAGVPLIEAGPATTTMLASTHFGHAWMFGMVAVIGVAASARRSLVDHGTITTRTTIAWIAGIGLLIYTRSIVSHAGSDGDLSFAVAVDGIHLVMVSLWTGVVWVTACAMGSSIDDDAATDALSWLGMLSTVATIALATILLSGLANTWRATAGSVAALWGSTYGTVLTGKVALVLVAAALGGINRWVFLPRMLARGGARGGARSGVEGEARDAARAAPAHRAFTTVLRIEAVVLAIVLMLAAVLGNLEPPGSM